MDKRSLVGYSPWGHKESDTTEELSMHIHIPVSDWIICLLFPLALKLLGDTDPMLLFLYLQLIPQCLPHSRHLIQS